jgi:hypothetical protein
MQTDFRDTQPAAIKWWAAQDARVRNYTNKTQWSASVQLQVDRMKTALSALYSGKIYEAYGRRQVSIKIDNPVVLDAHWLFLLESDWAAQGVTKTQTPQGILYRVA